MNDEREELFNSFHNLALRLIDLGAVVQNEIPKELVDITIDEFERDKHRVSTSLDMLVGEVIEYLESLKR